MGRHLGVGRRRAGEAQAVGVGDPLCLAGRRVRAALEDAVGQLQRLREAVPHHGLQDSRSGMEQLDGLHTY